MALSISELGHTAQRQAFSVIVDKLLRNLQNTDNKTEIYEKILHEAAFFYSDGADREKLEKIGEVLRDPENRWVRFLGRILDETDPGYAKKALLSMGYETFFRGTQTIRKTRRKYNCNIPWLILFDPTSACNMHCIGCWSGTYGYKSSLSYEDMDKIVSEGKALGTHLYMLTGGEPLVRKDDILKLCEKHQDCFFAAYTNSTLIDDALCKKVRDLGNLTFLLSIEGTPDTNDARRGKGHYQAVVKAMDLLKKYGIVFGTSICYTRDNIEAVTSDEFLRFLSEKGARFGFYFHYMPVGNNAVPELLPTVEQRKAMIDRIRYIRSSECDIEFFPMDFQNDGEYVGGCIAGGRNYFHINSNGDAEPCVFIHFSDANIHDKSIVEILQSPLFMAYHLGQPFNRNHLRPCPMLENPDLIKEIVHASGAHQTNQESPESVEHLTGKCIDYAAAWKPEAEKIWAAGTHPVPAYENYIEKKMKDMSSEAFDGMNEEELRKELESLKKQ